MEIVVCIKQVPETNEVEIDEEKGILKREGVASKMNPFDLHALELGISFKERLGGRVTAVTMGPPQAEAVLREAFMMGADEGILLSDRKFAGADTLATSFTIAAALRKLGDIDIIICGMQTTDGDTAQVGPGIAEILGFPHVSYVTRIVDVNDDVVVVDKDMADAIERMEVQLPCLLTVTRDINQPRLPSFRRKLATKHKEITVWRHKDLTGQTEEPEYFGLDGSPTQVEKIFPPKEERQHEIWEDDSAVLAERVHAKLKELKII